MGQYLWVATYIATIPWEYFYAKTAAETTALLSSNTEIRADLQAAAEIRRRQGETKGSWRKTVEDTTSPIGRRIKTDYENENDDGDIW